MTEASSFFNLLDYIYIAIMFASTLFGLANGFTRTLFSLLAWVGSGFASTAATPYVYGFLKDHFQEPIVGQLIASTGSYVICLVILMIISYLVSDAVKNSMLSGLDRSLGLLFGLIRGFLIPIGVVAVLLALNVPKDKFAVVETSKISSVLYDAMKGFIPTFNIPNLHKERDNAIEKYRHVYDKKQSTRDAKKVSTFPISHPKHHSLGVKIIKKEKRL